MINKDRTVDGVCDRFETPAYVLNGITYVPHFRNRNIFVGPGYPRDNLKRYSDKELQMMGAIPTIEMLWSRGESGDVSDRNP